MPTLPDKIGNRKEEIYLILRTHVGAEKAISAEELGRMIGVEPRTVRKLITELIVKGGHGEIIATTGQDALTDSDDPEKKSPGKAGYFWASCQQDIDIYLNVLTSRIHDIWERQKKAKEARLRLPHSKPLQPTLSL